MISLGFLFQFCKDWLFGLYGGRGWGKRAKDEKQKLHLPCAISQEQCSIWSWFLIHLCEMMISRIWWHANDDIQNFDFLGCQWGKRAKNFAKWQKYSVMHHIWGTIHHMVCHASYLRNHTLYDRHLWYTKCKMIMSPRFSFPFFKILIFWVVKRVKEQKNSPKWQKTLSLHISQEPTIHHMIFIYGAHV